MDSSHTHQDSNRLVDEQQQDIDLLEDIEIEEELRETQTQTETQSAAKKWKVGEPKSKHWQGYTVVWVEEGNPPIKTRKGRCNRCETLIAADSHRNGTNGLKNHTTSCSKKNATTARQTILNYTASADGTGTGSLTSWKFDQKAIRLALCEMIILDELPFIFVEREGFRIFVERLCPQFQIPSRQTIRTDCVKLFLECKDSLKAYFQKKNMGRVSITTDCWTAVNNTNFICVTAHCIGKDWVLHKKIISFCKIASHKANDIGEAVVASLKEWGLTNVICCTVDNASANDGAIRLVKSYLDTLKTDVLGGKFLHMRCVAHILNLVVQDGLEEIGMLVRRVKEAVKWIKTSPARSAQFHDCVNLLRERIDCKKSLCLDVPMMWNSTYLMLESAQPYEEAFKLFGNMYAVYINDLKQKKYNDLPIGPPDVVDWVNVRKMIEYLKKFYELILLVSGTTYATSHLFFVEMCDVFDLISELEMNDDYAVSSMASKMRMKIGKYWLEESELNLKMNRILYIAAVLDPRQKMKHVEKCFKSVYGTERAAALVREVTDSINEMFEFYKKAQNVTPTPARTANTSTAIRSHGRSDRRGALSLLSLQQGSDDEEPDESDMTEITLYLAEKPHKVAKNEVDEFDILQWWSKNSVRYPVIAEMARDILAIPISSVASEAAFSTGGCVLSAYRSSLTPNMVEALICAEDWLKTSSIDKKDEKGVPEEELEKEFEMVLTTITHGGTRTAQSALSQSGPSRVD